MLVGGSPKTWLPPVKDSVCGSIKVDDSALIDASLVVDSSFSARSFVRLGSSLSVFFGFAVVNSIIGVSVTGGLLGGFWLYMGSI
jgi:hypothetical protein